MSLRRRRYETDYQWNQRKNRYWKKRRTKQFLNNMLRNVDHQMDYNPSPERLTNTAVNIISYYEPSIGIGYYGAKSIYKGYKIAKRRHWMNWTKPNKWIGTWPYPNKNFKRDIYDWYHGPTDEGWTKIQQNRLRRKQKRIYNILKEINL